jgi:hypothetical protein
MTSIQYFIALYRLWAPVNGRAKAFRMALSEAFKPTPF